ncbi:MAG: hypothetical protein SGPRY_006964 [Prymnesium sp.]
MDGTGRGWAVRKEAALLALGCDVIQRIASLLLPFHPSPRWKGPLAFHVFKLGEYGLGYYEDNADVGIGQLVAFASTCKLARSYLRPNLLCFSLYRACAMPDYQIDPYALEALVRSAEEHRLGVGEAGEGLRQARRRCDRLMERREEERPLRQQMGKELIRELEKREGCFSAFGAVLVEHQVLEWSTLQALLREVLWPTLGRAHVEGPLEGKARVYTRMYEIHQELALELWRAAREVLP